MVLYIILRRGESMNSDIIDEEKRRVIMDISERLKKLEPILSRISDEDIVRVIREDRDRR